MNFMSREEAKIKIDNILNHSKPIKTGILLPIRRKSTFNVYSIPLEYLVPNIYNDRIAMKTREFEAFNNKELSLENKSDIEYIYELIEKESPNDNERTLRDLADKGQLVDGIITNDGIIIDGNRRATLLRKLFLGEARRFNENIENFRYFNAIVLTGDFDKSEIMSLETQIQIGEDRKVDYNPINLYIKVDNLTKVGYNDRQIASFMNVKESDVKNKREIFNLMNEYLSSIGKPNHFTLLDGLEDQFINTRSVFTKLDNNTYITYDDWEYTEEDVVEFKQICYDYLRAKFEGKKYREILIGRPNKSDGVFIKKDVWEKFKTNHENIIEQNDPQNEADWELLGNNQFIKNLRNASKELEDTLQEKTVTTLVERIYAQIRSLYEILETQEEVLTDDLDKLDLVRKELVEILKQFKK